MITVMQNFNPPIKFCFCNENSPIIMKSRQWKIENNEKLAGDMQSMGYIGQMQIEEVWKHAGYFTADNSKKIWARVPDKEKTQNEVAHTI